MLNICFNCGEYQADKEVIILDSVSYAVCKYCDFKSKFESLPLYILSGASGIGKTSIMKSLQAEMLELVFLDGDALVMNNDFSAESKENLLRIFKNIHQSGKPVLVSVCFFPQHFKESIEKRYFRRINFLTLFCEEQDLVKRLKSRPSLRHNTILPFIETNRWVNTQISNNNNEMIFFSNSQRSLEQSKNEIKEWLINDLDENSIN
jgi:gluconate kinase